MQTNTNKKSCTNKKKSKRVLEDYLAADIVSKRQEGELITKLCNSNSDYKWEIFMKDGKIVFSVKDSKTGIFSRLHLEPSIITEEIGLLDADAVLKMVKGVRVYNILGVEYGDLGAAAVSFLLHYLADDGLLWTTFIAGILISDRIAAIHLKEKFRSLDGDNQPAVMIWRAFFDSYGLDGIDFENLLRKLIALMYREEIKS